MSVQNRSQRQRRTDINSQHSASQRQSAPATSNSRQSGTTSSLGAGSQKWRQSFCTKARAYSYKVACARETISIIITSNTMSQKSSQTDCNCSTSEATPAQMTVQQLRELSRQRAIKQTTCRSKHPRHDESSLQVECVKWFRLRYPRLARLLFAVPNGGARNAVTGRILKAEGVVAGVADLLLLVANRDYHALCIEMKTAKGRQQETQKAWQHDVEAHGFKYVVCRSFADFTTQVSEYLNCAHVFDCN